MTGCMYQGHSDGVEPVAVGVVACQVLAKVAPMSAGGEAAGGVAGLARFAGGRGRRRRRYSSPGGVSGRVSTSAGGPSEEAVATPCQIRRLARARGGVGHSPWGYSSEPCDSRKVLFF